jgi:hypothetical protein
VTQGLSEESQALWDAMARGMADGVSHPLDRELLNQFVIGVHRRGEELSAHELKTLAEQLDAEPELVAEVVAFVEPALGLLEAYDRTRPTPVDNEDDDDYVGDDDVGPGILVI